jgi:hypothetical protein
MKQQFLDELRARGIEPPRQYRMGFSHANCGGFCIKGGHGHFALLLQHFPARFAYHEAKEQELRAHLGKDVSILTDRAGGLGKKPMTLKDFRARVEAGFEFDQFDLGACNCFIGEAP